MSWEALSAVASLVTAVVITATAIAAVVQIRHLRVANQLGAALSLYHQLGEPDLERARDFVRLELEERMKDPVYRDELASGKFERAKHLEIKVGNYWEQFGLLTRQGLLDRQLFVDYGGSQCLGAWRTLRDVTRVLRSRSPESWRNFEWLARLSASHVESAMRDVVRHPKWGDGIDEDDVPETPEPR